MDSKVEIENPLCKRLPIPHKVLSASEINFNFIKTNIYSQCDVELVPAILLPKKSLETYINTIEINGNSILFLGIVLKKW